jgi:hypothetical protein
MRTCLLLLMLLAGHLSPAGADKCDDQVLGWKREDATKPNFGKA